MAPRPRGEGSRAMLRDMILSGRFKPGAYLPSVRELAVEIDAPKSTVHNILLMLQQEGLVQIQPNKRGALVLDAAQRGRVLRRVFVRPSDYGNFGRSRENAMMLAGLCAAAERRNVELMITFSDSLRFLDEVVELYNKDEIQGVVYMECGNVSLVGPLENAGIPYVVMDDDPGGVDCVKCDQCFRDIARRAVYYLHSKGHKKLGVLHGAQSVYLYSEMLAGFRGALVEEGLEFNPDWAIETGSPANDEEHIKEISKVLAGKDCPTAFFAARDYRAAVFYEACARNGVDIPGRVSVVSYDDVNWPEGPGRGLTVFKAPFYELGEAAMDMLQGWVSSGDRPCNREVKSPLVERGSVKSLL